MVFSMLISRRVASFPCLGVRVVSGIARWSANTAWHFASLVSCVFAAGWRRGGCMLNSADFVLGHRVLIHICLRGGMLLNKTNACNYAHERTFTYALRRNDQHTCWRGRGPKVNIYSLNCFHGISSQDRGETSWTLN